MINYGGPFERIVPERVWSVKVLQFSECGGVLPRKRQYVVKEDFIWINWLFMRREEDGWSKGSDERCK